uniref:Uncharacterized protein n=1 Tax=Arundo donax TaxID=35708 RepID=A0A0A8ZGY1_ARUDO
MLELKDCSCLEMQISEQCLASNLLSCKGPGHTVT